MNALLNARTLKSVLFTTQKHVGFDPFKPNGEMSYSVLLSGKKVSGNVLGVQKREKRLPRGQRLVLCLLPHCEKLKKTVR